MMGRTITFSVQAEIRPLDQNTRMACIDFMGADEDDVEGDQEEVADN